MKSGGIIVVSAPSGAGKTTVVELLLKKMPGIKKSVSATTRLPRAGEENNRDYFFVSRKEFERMIQNREFAEWAEVHGQLYGTPKKSIEESVSKGDSIILNIDVQGGLAIKKLYHSALLIFIEPPSMAVLEKRLRGRKTDTESEIQRRLKMAAEEMKYSSKYDYVVINDKIDETVGSVKEIIEKKTGGKDGLPGN